MTIREFLQALQSGRYLIAAAVVVVLGSAIGMILRTETSYESRAVIQLTSVDDEGATGETFSVNADLGAIRSTEVVDAASLTLSEQGIEAVPASDVSADYNSSGQVVISASASTPEQAEANANAFADAFVVDIANVVSEQIADLDARRGLLREQLATVDAQIAANPADALAAAERSTIIAQYQSLSAQMSIAQSIVAPGQLAQLAQGASEEGTSTTVVLGVALLAGLVIGVGLALLRRAFDTRVHGANEAGELGSTEVLADLFGTKEADRECHKTGVLPVARRAATPFTEAIRQLRTTTQVAVGRSGHVMVAVTATDRTAPREFITANLAASFALSGRPTIIVRGDLRRNALAKLLPFDDDTRVVGGVRPTTIPNLSYYELPDSALDPADYLATQEVRALLAGLREDAEVVVVDSPPVLAAADATIIGGQMDGLVLIASSPGTHRVVLSEAAGRLRKNHVALLGLALTGRRTDRALMSASTYGDSDAGPLAPAPAAKETETVSTTDPITSDAESAVQAQEGTDGAGDRGAETAVGARHLGEAEPSDLAETSIDAHSDGDLDGVLLTSDEPTDNETTVAVGRRRHGAD